jgi:hypothetical protein
MKRVSTHMTLLDRGLALTARREGRTIEYIEAALNRSRRNLQKLFKKHGYTRRPMR